MNIFDLEQDINTKLLNLKDNETEKHYIPFMNFNAITKLTMKTVNRIKILTGI